MSWLFRIHLIAVLLVAPLLGVTQSTVLVWQDEFNYTGLPDSEKWGYDVGGDGWGNNELQFYTEADTNNARVQNGKLIIEAHKENYSGNQYTSTRLITKNKGDWKYGRFEIKAKVPAGTGTWPAIWMLPTDWEYGGWPSSGEIDIMEYVGYEPNVIHQTVHTQAYNHLNGTEQSNASNVETAEEEFHLYAIEWTPDKIDFFVDGRLRFTFENEGTWQKWPFDKRFHLLLNVAIGGNWGGVQGVDDSIFPVQMEVDYVRVYKQIDEFQISGDEYIQPYAEHVEYSVSNVVDAEFDWSVPEDAGIVSGQGTNAISVNWGDSEGSIALELTVNEETYHYELPVKLLTVPEGAEHVLEHFDDGNIENISNPNSEEVSFSFSETASELKISYHNTDPDLWPKFIIDFERPIDLSNHQSMEARLKTFNKSGSVNMRIDLIDQQGRQTNKSPVFTIEPYSDGKYHDYHFNFAGNWAAGAPNFGETVNKERIRKAVIYLNYGSNGVDNASDSLWIDVLKMNAEPEAVSELRQTRKIKVIPNPAETYFYLDINQIESINIVIFSATGQTVKRVNQAYTAQKIDVSGLPQGLYLLKISDKKGLPKYHAKLIIQ
ncbi:MAG: family 16 glycosylhydrolase [Bacteroidales bacterium]|nr:family 16 glycosylhydrolase [Bacteroidales bacterium]MCF8336386.1 family 16 glycosylhydrolase [Bacteroidales bacterium]